MFVLVNLKAYDVDPVAIAEAARDAANGDTRVAVAPQPAQLAGVASTGVETWAQHVAPVDAGSHTGHVRPQAVAAVGAAGTLLNHSERRLGLADIAEARRAAARAGLSTIICANDPEQAAAVAALGPDAIAVEPPALIGGDVSVATADPEVVGDAVDAVATVDNDVAVYCGAGLSTAADIRAAADLGADGVLLASAVAKAPDPQATLASLLD